MIKTGKFVTILLWVVIIISAVLVISLMANISDNETDPTMQSWINTNLVWAYILFIVGGGLALFFGIVQMVSDKKAAKAGLIVIVFFGAVVALSYVLASDTMPQFLGVDKFIESGELTTKVAKWIDTGLYATYILFGLAILATAFSSVSRLLNK